MIPYIMKKSNIEIRAPKRKKIMGILWSRIIKQYRRHCADSEFADLDDAADDFLKYLENYPELNEKDRMNEYLIFELINFYYSIKSDAEQIDGSSDENEKDEHLYKGKTDALAASIKTYRLYGKNEHFSEMTRKRLMEIAKLPFGGMMEIMKDEEVPTKNMGLWKNGFYEYITSRFLLTGTRVDLILNEECGTTSSSRSLMIGGIIDHNLRFSFDVSPV